MDAMKLMTEGMIKENRPAFNVGDTVRVSVRIKEGERERIQAFEGTVIAKRHGGIQGDVYRAPFFLRSWRRACVPREFPVCGKGRSGAQGQSAPREAVLPAQPHRQGCQGQRAAVICGYRKKGRMVAFSLFSVFCRKGGARNGCCARKA